MLVRPHADPGPFSTSTSFLTGEQSDSGPMGKWTTVQANQGRQFPLSNAAQILAPSGFFTSFTALAYRVPSSWFVAESIGSTGRQS